MTKRKIVMITLFVTLFLAALPAWYIADFLRPIQTKTPHAESKIMITSARGLGAEKTMEIDDPEDAAFLFALFGKKYTAEYDSPSCPFDWCRISFVHKRGSIDFYPAMDGCEFVRYRGKYFFITQDEKIKLMEICRKYDKKQ